MLSRADLSLGGAQNADHHFSSHCGTGPCTSVTSLHYHYCAIKWVSPSQPASIVWLSTCSREHHLVINSGCIFIQWLSLVCHLVYFAEDLWVTCSIPVSADRCITWNPYLCPHPTRIPQQKRPVPHHQPRPDVTITLPYRRSLHDQFVEKDRLVWA